MSNIYELCKLVYIVDEVRVLRHLDSEASVLVWIGVDQSPITEADFDFL